MASKGRVICLCGMDAGSRDDVLSMSKSVELWTVNEGYTFLHRPPARVFQMHPRNWRDDERRLRNQGCLPENVDAYCFGRNAKHIAWLQSAPCPVYCQRKWEDIPASMRYPFEAVRQCVGIGPEKNKRLYVTSTFGYAMALALAEHWTQGEAGSIQEIKIAGIELYGGREGRWEKPNLEFYLGMAIAAGIRVTLPIGGTSLLNAPLYAIEGPYPGTVDWDGIDYETGNVGGDAPVQFVTHPITGVKVLTPSRGYERSLYVADFAL